MASDKMSNFRYSEKEINSLISNYKDSNKLQKATMKGVFNDLLVLKQKVESLYDEHIFFLSYWKSECAYHGWSFSDDESVKSMAFITDSITEKFKEIYALILCGLDEQLAEDSM